MGSSSALASVAGASATAAVLGALDGFLKVLRRFEKGDFGFSVTSSSLPADFSFFEDNHGRLLLRLSLAGEGVSTLASPLVTTSVGTVAGVKVEVAKEVKG